MCGDGVVEVGEACDEGAANSDDEPGACRTTCVLATCGDGVVDPGEECDGGNASGDLLPDGCRAGCRAAFCGDGVVDSREVCDDGAANSDVVPDACRTDCVAPGCGDGVVDSGEACDDGAANSDLWPDACRTACVEPVCGDGVLDAGEACDDGPANSDLLPGACRTTCMLPACGDGVIDAGEACDDGAANSDDAPDSCRLACVLPTCGDGVVDGDEECDNGRWNNDILRNACRRSCTRATCGDGVVDDGEACDEGAENSDSGSGACRTRCTWFSCGDRVVDPLEECDDGAANSDQLPGACRTSCRAAACGDRVVDPGEVCDDGNDLESDGCNRCEVSRLELASLCRTDGSTGICYRAAGDLICWDPNGDGAGRCAVLKEPGESCFPSVNSTCGHLMGCLPAEGGGYTCQPSCGDGEEQPDFGEQCDDGNLEIDDNCSPDCRAVAATCAAPVVLELEFQPGQGGYYHWSGSLLHHPHDRGTSCLPGAGPSPDVVLRFTAPEAGSWTFEYAPFNGVGSLTLLGPDCGAAVPESCLSGSGELRVTRAMARGETVYLSLDGVGVRYFVVTAARPVCGDGVRQPFEECDDGNTVTGDGCSPACLFEPVP